MPIESLWTESYDSFYLRIRTNFQVKQYKRRKTVDVTCVSHYELFGCIITFSSGPGNRLIVEGEEFMKTPPKSSN